MINSRTNEEGRLVENTTGDWPLVGGYWRIDHRTVLRSELPVLLEVVDTVIDAILIADVRQEDEQLWLHYRVCDVRMENSPAFNHTILPDLFLTSLPDRARPAVLQQSETGWRLKVPRQYELRGMVMERPAEDPLPTVAEDLRVFDQDRDGARRHAHSDGHDSRRHGAPAAT